MSADSLLDTNILVYAVDSSPENAAKKETAIGLIENADFGLSAQVLQEFYVTVTRKLKRPLTPGEAMAFLDHFNAFPIVATDIGIVTEGIRNSVKYQISYWDGAILAAAGRLHAHTLYSEDLSHSQQYGDVKVVNPFLK